jgi:transketolase
LGRVRQDTASEPSRAHPAAGEVAHLAREIRRTSLTMVHRAQLGHPGGDLSAADVLASLYGHALRFDPAKPDDPNRDRFILSKGHASAALYATLAIRGVFPVADLETFMQPLSPLNGHPDRNKVPGVEANTGPLGHGLPISVGLALGARLTGGTWRTFVLTGDGELQEGSNWEALMAASQFRLSSLTLIVDRNRLQQGDSTENTVTLDPLGDRLRAFGWAVTEIDGHDLDAILTTLDRVPLEVDRPTAIVANTIKGRGVSFMENRVEWHHGVVKDADLARALAELGGEP